MRRRGNWRLRVEWAQTRTVCAGDGHDDDGAVTVPRSSPVHAAQFGQNLVVGEGKEVRELQEGDRLFTRKGAPDGDADDRRFRKWRVPDLARELIRQPASQTEHIAFGILNVLSIQRNLAVGSEVIPERFAHGLQHAE